MKIVAISDTHTQWANLVIPECDILISAGDYSNRGEIKSVVGFHTWLTKQPAKHIISLQGNHELFVMHNFSLCKDLVYSIDQKIRFVDDDQFIIDGIKICCKSIQPEFGGWAYNAPADSRAKSYANIDDTTDILVTHCPAYGILDTTEDGGEKLGCDPLLERIMKLKLKLHIFGHIHGSSGVQTRGDTKHINAAICNEAYEPVNPVREIEI
jgi:Icc-related predicted phosphoesterase